jgi:phage terminase large subunit
MTAIRGYQLAEAGLDGIILCAREYMISLEDSSMSEVKSAIRSVDWLNDYYDIGEKYIRTNSGRISYSFAGLARNLDSIKSKTRIHVCWVDEAESVSEAAWRKLIPTVREKDSELWITWNPEREESATNQRFRVNPPKGAMIVSINWQDNPWFPAELDAERLEDLRCRPDTYDHIWEGDYLRVSDAQVFKGKFVVEEFDDRDESGRLLLGDPLHGADFGFHPDPATAVQVYVHGNTLYVRREAYKHRLELDHMSGHFKRRIPGIEGYVVRADSSRPDSISYLRRHGIPRCTGEGKLKIEDGIAFMKSFDRIVIHPECVETAREFRNYSHKIDKRTEDVLTDIVDDWNHVIDAIRYALAPLIRSRKSNTSPMIGLM